jgi:8-oxo-dGTP pyrophosphatase MutT (NUDIX family)
MRELKEEIGTNNVRVIGRLEDSLRYEWPEELYVRGYRGQEQVYFLVSIGKDIKVPLETNPTREFDMLKWVSMGEFLKMIEGFKAQTYREALNKLEAAFPGLIQK